MSARLPQPCGLERLLLALVYSEPQELALTQCVKEPEATFYRDAAQAARAVLVHAGDEMITRLDVFLGFLDVIVEAFGQFANT